MKSLDPKELAMVALESGEIERKNEELGVPEPFDEEAVPLERRNWVRDYGDQLVPKTKGFITDFVYHTRGYMIPTLACIWSGLFLLSSAIKREAWLKWMPTTLFPNLYMIIVGPAGRAKKTTAITQIGTPILRDFRNWITDANLYKMKYINIAKDMTSPEALIDSMLPERKPGDDFFFMDEEGNNILGPNGKAVVYRKTSETTIVVSELSTFLSSSSYANGTTNLLLDLFDAHETWEWKTLGRGKKVLRRLCTNFVAGTTVDGLRGSIPQAAKGDGFISRTLMVYVPTSLRKYDMPRQAVGAPTTEDMAKRLAWIAQNAVGEFTLSAEARKEYTRWFDWFYQQMEDNPGMEGAISRMDVNLLKVALLIRCNRYEEEGNEITLEDLRTAIGLLEATYASLPFLLGQVDVDDMTVALSKVELRLRGKQKEGFLKWEIGSSLRLKSDMLHAVLDELSSRGLVEFELDGKRYGKSTRRAKERIFWIGDGYDGNADTTGSREGSYSSSLTESRKHKKSRKTPGSEPYIPEEIYDGGDDSDAGAEQGDTGLDASETKGGEEATCGVGEVVGRPVPRPCDTTKKHKRNSKNDKANARSNKNLVMAEAEEGEGEYEEMFTIDEGTPGSSA